MPYKLKILLFLMKMDKKDNNFYDCIGNRLNIVMGSCKIFGNAYDTSKIFTTTTATNIATELSPGETPTKIFR